MGKIVQVDEGVAGPAKPLVIPARARRRTGATGTPPYGRFDVREKILSIHAENNNSANVGDNDAPVGGWSKRAFDMLAALAGIIVLAPLLVLIAVAVRLDSPGPSIFKQDRGGFRGRTFRIYKFRTMTVTENSGVVQARFGDARITRLGNFLRRSSWDELPQLFNVLMGDMSLIGPRPHAVEHDQQFESIDPRYAIRRNARPGVTGLAQVSGCRGPTETPDKVRRRTGFDAEYVRSWSWAMDVRIVIDSAVLLSKSDPQAI